MSSRPSEPKFDPREPISGYIVRELIGRGGFGEVWRAEAPGGLSKAIKMVHGGINFSRAERELRALQRIKDVRHPLILSIERIEVISGTLVIVTELADGSLRDVFQKYRDKGQPGIPRDKLLSYINDAADALDYIYEEHSLQHLDIKPENLLMVGNRLKVGDFGLIKNIYERGASLVNGLTPTYAPPELFEGKPTKQSDQYSLAIVYQHMLTGELPFEGATPAQLAREHLAGVPRLTLLPKAERPIIARALAKSPGDRYDNCKQLVKHLEAALAEAADTDVDDGPSPGADVSRTRTVSIPGQPPAPDSKGATSSVANPGAGAHGHAGLIDPVLGAIEASLSPTRPPNDTTSRRSEAIVGAGFVPTVFIGIGGTGGLVLQELRSRIEDSLGPLSEIPSLQFVLIDTDGKALNVLMRDHDVCQSMDVAALPLRRPEDYRFRESKLNKWLHRRWIYNMPRSLTTEGYRPLGRLALVDHAARVKTSLRTAIGKAASAENAAKSAEKTGLPFRHGHVRIVMAASVSGATGGGMLLDLAYAARSELKKRSLPDEDVLACLLHAAPGSPAERDKATANAYALLSELGHYSGPGHFYPGENAVETPQFHGDNRTFRTTYLVNLGHDVSTEKWQTAAVEMAEYLYLTTATPGKLVVDAARHADEARLESSPTTVLVRSLNVQRLDRAYSDDVAASITEACRDVVAIWQSGRQPATVVEGDTIPADVSLMLDAPVSPIKRLEAQAADRAAEWLKECGLEPEGMQNAARRLLEQTWECDEATYLRQLFNRVCHEGQERRLKRVALIDSAVRVVDRLVGDDAVSDDAQTLRDALRDGLAVFGGQLSAGLSVRVRKLVDQTDAGVDTARHTALALSSQLKELRSELERRKRVAATTADELRQAAMNGPTPAPASGFALFRRRKPVETDQTLAQQLADYAERRVAEMRLSALQMFLDTIHNQLSALADQLLQLSRELSCLNQDFQPEIRDSESDIGGGPETVAFVQRIQAALRRHREDIALVVYETLQDTTLSGNLKLQRFLGGRSEVADSLRGPLQLTARLVVADLIRRTTVGWIEQSAREAASGESTACGRLVAEFLAERRAKSKAPLEPVLVLAPDSVDLRVLSEAFACCKEARLVPARTSGITVFAEVGARRLEEVADEVVEQQELYRQLAQKLHTREDVDWSPLPPAHGQRRDSGSKSVRVPIK